MKILGIVIARRGSERLPGKVLRELAGKTLLFQVLARAARSRLLHDLVVALPDNREDDVIESLCLSNSQFCFRGSELDLMDRVYRTAIAFGADIVVPLRASCPIVDGALIDRVLARLLESPDADWATNRLPKLSFPIGLEVDAIRIDALRRAWTDESHPGSRRHVESYFLRRPDLFKSVTLQAAADHSAISWHITELPKLDQVRRIFEHFGEQYFLWEDALRVWQEMKIEPAMREHSGRQVTQTPFDPDKS
ncbi:MAG: hypothetical protein H6508_01560 [Calditrichaeota bacterium]|nr:hypothetical protein [Calditrichota bacterium]